MVPYRGGTTQITGLLAGDIPLGHESVNVALPLYRDKKIKIIALTGQKRLSLAPEIPIIAETFPGFDLGIWQSVVAPAGTPKEIVDKLHAALKKVHGDAGRAREASSRPASSPRSATARRRSRTSSAPGRHPQQGHQGGRHEDRMSGARPMPLVRSTLARRRAARRDRRRGGAARSGARAIPAASIRLIVPFPPGGPADLIARFVGQRMSERLGPAGR